MEDSCRVFRFQRYARADLEGVAERPPSTPARRLGEIQEVQSNTVGSEPLSRGVMRTAWARIFVTNENRKV
jgi:hypothetical protein